MTRSPSNIARLCLTALIAAPILLAGCGGGDSGSPTTTTPSTSTVTPTKISGVAAKGLLLNAIVSIYAVTDGAVSQTALASVRTDASTGAFSTSVTTSGALVVIVTTDASTQMLDELSGVAGAAPTGLVLHTVVDSLTNIQPLAVSPLTETAFAVASGAAGGLTVANIDAANSAVSSTFLAGASAIYTQPIDLKNYAAATAAQQEATKLLVALAVAANQGIATNSAGALCTATYSQNLVCMVSGLGKLISLSANGTVTLNPAAAYVAAAYKAISDDTVTVQGGKLPSVLGLDTATAAETAFETTVSKQLPLPGYNAGATPLAETKALIADVRTNIVDQATTQTFGYAPTLTALQKDVDVNVNPVVRNTAGVVAAAYTAAQIFQQVNATTGAPRSIYLTSPVGITVDSTGSAYVIESDQTVTKVTAAGVSSRYAGIPWVPGSVNGAPLQSTFNFGGYGTTVVSDSAGNIYVADSGNYVIRKIASDGTVSTLAGQVAVSSSIDGTGSSASFTQPSALAIDATGNLWVVDVNAIREVTPVGVVTTLTLQNACSFISGSQECLSPVGIAAATDGTLYVSDANGYIATVSISGNVSVLAGSGTIGSADGLGAAASFAGANAIAIDAAGNLYVSDGLYVGGATIRKVTAQGQVTTIAGQVGVVGNTNGTGSAASFADISDIALGSDGNLLVTDVGNNSLRQVTTSGAVTTILQGAAIYKNGRHYACGYDPLGLQTTSNVVLCRYGGLIDNVPAFILLTVTSTGAGQFTVTSQPFDATVASPLPAAEFNPVYSFGYGISTTIPALSATFSFTTATGGAQSAAFTGPFYVTATGGQVLAALTVAESANWNATTGSGTISASGTLSGGTGGVSLVNATLGTDTSIVVANTARLTGPGSPRVISAGSPAASLSGTFDVPQFETSAFTYSIKAVVGTPIYDKSQLLAFPGTLSLAGSIEQMGINGAAAVPFFSGSISASFQGIPLFDVTKPYGPTNYVTTQAQITGTVAFPGDRILTVSATGNASLEVATPALPDSATVTYTYSSPAGTAEINVTGKYDATNGYSGTITNNAGVTVTLAEPIGGSVTGTITANGTSTASIKGAFVYYSDGTSESLF